MKVLEALKSRRSIRHFSSRPIARDTLLEILECARLAPTARNIQPWEFVVITDRPMLERIGNLAENGRFIAESACCIAVFCQDTKYYLEDGCAATENILISAHALGIASCWVAGDKKDYAKKIGELLAVPENSRLVSLIALGYISAGSSVVPKRELNDMVHWEKYTQRS